jgi:hypothetical protein
MLNIYLLSKVVCFVLFVVMRSTPNQDASHHVVGKLMMRRGAWAWFHDVWTCCAIVLEY